MKLTTKNSIGVSIIFVSALVLAACNAPSQETTPAEPINEPAVNQDAATSDSATSTTDQTEGTQAMAAEVSTTGTYDSPAGPEEIEFILVIDENGVITDAEAEVLAENKTSILRQKSFADAFSESVVGKNINELENIDRIGGSSLTTGSFNRALPELKAQLS